MTWHKSIRQSHRWISLAFTISVVVVTVAVLTQEEPAAWLLYLPLLPLALLLVTGLYLFVLPYVTRRRTGRRTADAA